jgi:hypothetical protein
MTENAKGRSESGNPSDLEDHQTRRRLLALERETEELKSKARWSRIAVVVALILGMLGAFSHGIPGLTERRMDLEVLRAQHLILEDGDGVARGEWRVDEAGDSRLTLLDRQGRTRFSMAVLSGGSPGLSLINANGQRRAGLALLPDESANLALADGAGMPRAVLGLTSGDAAQLLFADADGITRVALGLDEAGFGNIMLPEDSSSVEEPESTGGGE